MCRLTLRDGGLMTNSMQLFVLDLHASESSLVF